MVNFDLRQIKYICIENWGKGLCGGGKCPCQEFCFKYLKESLLPKDFEIDSPKEQVQYNWVVVENDGYTYAESGLAYDVIDAAWKAIEFNTNFINSITIKKKE